jgi:hypothetical protein
VNVATHSATGENLNAGLGVDRTEELTVDFNFANLDVRMYDSMLADN